MVQVMGHNIHRYFTGVFAAGSALAGVGGLMWAIFSQSVRPTMGGEQLIFAFIVVIIGGLGSVTGSLVGALLVGLSYNYVAYLIPKAAIGVTMALMVIVLLLRPSGLGGTAKLMAPDADSSRGGAARACAAGGLQDPTSSCGSPCSWASSSRPWSSRPFRSRTSS